MMLFLWTGPKHSGKTTCAAELARRARHAGLLVAGLLAPSVYRNGRLVGFEALDLQSGARSPLAVRRGRPGEVGRFHFMDEGLRLGRHVLQRAAIDKPDVVIVDEFGPLELNAGGWRSGVDALVHAGRTPLVVVVRQELAEAVRAVYGEVPSRVVHADGPTSVPGVLHLLEQHRAARGSG